MKSFMKLKANIQLLIFTIILSADQPNPCESDPCKNDGECKGKPDNSSFKCMCQIGWRGILCELEVCK